MKQNQQMFAGARRLIGLRLATAMDIQRLLEREIGAERLKEIFAACKQKSKRSRRNTPTRIHNGDH
jgi:hypothetical protein